MLCKHKCLLAVILGLEAWHCVKHIVIQQIVYAEQCALKAFQYQNVMKLLLCCSCNMKPLKIVRLFCIMSLKIVQRDCS